ncbi:6,7-dimethyl-8-ribityllumazine synthase [Bryobacter aggregatus]|uniref:6,7-dimethyl-8-ribityllumazine synthase n=1 Tax=Bryobacter aggregatus TaxID=360054 RepID=UPI00069025F6|nr:6,7-dimethyl-8-ribityllumazine synthase [Bryobacter aggregatus]
MSSFHPNEIKVREGLGTARGLRVAIVVSRFNSLVTDRLLDGALGALARAGAEAKDVEVIKVPGAWEMPVVVGELARLGKTDAVVCLGCVVRGDTPHFDYVAGENAKGIGAVAKESGMPVANGVLTTNTMEQALDRAGGKMGNKGADAAMGAIEMANLLREIKSAKGV